MSIDIQDASELIKTNKWSALVVGEDGSIIDIIHFHEIPKADEILKIKYDNAAFQLIQQSSLSEKELQKIIDNLLDAIRYSKTHELKPGANIIK